MAEKLFNVERPLSLDSVKGHEVVVARISHWFETGNVPSFILSEGCRGCGKTTTARIIARYVNCDNPSKNGPCGECESCRKAMLGNNLDIIELDAASKNKVEDVKTLEEKIHYMPFYKKKVVILDEVHRLSEAAFSSLLKLLEEPPEHCIFIFCTTEAQKIPDTIRSRARQLTFSALPVNIIVERLREICTKYNVNAEEEALAILARNANGAMRDAVNYLEDFFDGDITVERVRVGLGVPSTELVFTIIEGMLEADFKCIRAFRESVARGVRLNILIEHLVRTCMDAAQIKIGADMSLINGTENYKEGVIRLSKKATFVRFAEFIKAFGTVRYVGVESYQVESVIVSTMIEESSVSILARKIEALESELAGLKSGRVVVDDIVATPLFVGNDASQEVSVMEMIPDNVGVFSTGIAEGFVNISNTEEIPFNMEGNWNMPMEKTVVVSASTKEETEDDYYVTMAANNITEEDLHSYELSENSDIRKMSVMGEEITQKTEDVIPENATVINEAEEKIFSHNCDACENVKICTNPDECLLDKEDKGVEDTVENTGDNISEDADDEDTFSAIFGDCFSFS